MRYTLEQLKAMDDKTIQWAWGQGKFPFDLMGCGHCLVHHWPISMGALCGEHRQVTEQMRRFFPSPIFGPGRIAVLRTNLDELYALRLFYDSLYPQPTPEPTEAVADDAASTAEVTKKEKVCG